MPDDKPATDTPVVHAPPPIAPTPPPTPPQRPRR